MQDKEGRAGRKPMKMGWGRKPKQRIAGRKPIN